MENFKNESIQVIAGQVAKELDCSLIAAVSKMQATCVRNSNESMLEDLIAYKNTLIEEMFS